MKSKHTPDRVHVVRPPENDSYPDIQNVEILRTLAKIGDKLKRSEAERYELLAELREYRKSLRDLEDKADNSEKAYLAVENKIQSSGAVGTENVQRQVRFEKTLKATEDKMLKAIAGQAVIDNRLRATEDKQEMMDQRIDQSVAEQTKLSRQIDIATQDKARMMRKVERLEEIVLETQETLRAKAMVLLTDQNKETAKPAPSALSAPDWSNVKSEKVARKPLKNQEKEPAIIYQDAWTKHINYQNASVVALIFAALVFGWVVNKMSKPSVGGENVAVVQPQTNSSDNNTFTQGSASLENVSMTANPTPDNVLDYSDDQLLQALDDNPDALAAQLNDIEPAAVEPQATAEPVAATPAESAVETATVATSYKPAIVDPKITPEMENFEAVAYKQDATIQQAIQSEKSTDILATRITPDRTLPDQAKRIETQAFSGNGEAQHDLAAIYTAGQMGVDQNFERAALWFREASDNQVPNARYNLGVLYHQGLGKERNLDRALYWYREAAKLGHAEAQYNLGIAHIEGIGTEYNPQLAAAFFERAANNGIMEAAYNLGLIYDNSLLGQSKPEEALLWYKIAADQGSVEAKSAMEQLAKNLQIGMDDIDNLVERMQIINQSVKGRRAGPDMSATNKSSSFDVDSGLVKQIQEYLMLTGGYAGPADGINGTATQNSIRAYQAANNISVTGEISEELLNSMVGGAIDRLNKAN